MENQIQETKMDQFVNLTTGEILGEGIFMSKEELERKQEAQIKRINYAYLMNNRSEFQTHISSNFGSFYFNNYMKLLTKLKNNPALLFRFLYLCTYANYDGYLKYGLNSSLYMKENDFGEVFKLSKGMVTKLKKELYDNKLIKKYEDGRIVVNNDYYSRGKLYLGDMLNSSRVFDNGIRELYLNSNPREHKRIGVIVPLLPYLNKYYNILCENPLEKDENYIKPLTLTEICNIVGYDVANRDKLKKMLENVTVNGKPTVAYISHADARFFLVNPAVFYKGNSVSDLDVISKLFNLKNKKKNENE
jgi:hypothetical protein